MKASEEFQIGKHSIGYINSDFQKYFGDQTFEEKNFPSFQKLGKSMNDATIEHELSPGFCGLGDVLAFLDAAPKECKDGYANIFYTPTLVVFVRWYDFSGHWRVSAWARRGSTWGGDSRVFSPATDTLKSKPSILGDFVPRAEFDSFVKKVETVLKLG